MTSSDPDSGSNTGPDSNPDLQSSPGSPSEGGRSAAALSRRQVLGLGAAAVITAASAGSVARPSAVAAASATPTRDVAQAVAQQPVAGLKPTIRPRSDWAGDLGVTGELIPEDDVRFLLVHHTASTNNYEPDDVADQIRGFYQFHTGPEKGWPDVAYNFFVDRYGVIWEGRQGSITSPIRGDATGGSQGFALLCSLIGNHHEAPVTAEQQASLVQLLAWLADSYVVDTTVGATTTFTSRGSSRWPSGVEVNARTISGHRDMSTTSCPGDFAYPLLEQEIPAAVTAILATTGAVTPSSTSTPSSSTPADPSTPGPPTSADPTTSNTPSSSGTPAPGAEPTGMVDNTLGSESIDQPNPTTDEVAGAAVNPGEEGDGRPWPLLAAGAVAAAAAGAGVVTRRRTRDEPTT